MDTTNHRRNRRGSGLGCLVLALLVATVFVAFLVWAWHQPGNGTPSYWH